MKERRAIVTITATILMENGDTVVREASTPVYLLEGDSAGRIIDCALEIMDDAGKWEAP